jgi:hypothetical protein
MKRGTGISHTDGYFPDLSSTELVPDTTFFRVPAPSWASLGAQGNAVVQRVTFSLFYGPMSLANWRHRSRSTEEEQARNLSDPCGVGSNPANS